MLNKNELIQIFNKDGTDRNENQFQPNGIDLRLTDVRLMDETEIRALDLEGYSKIPPYMYVPVDEDDNTFILSKHNIYMFELEYVAMPSNVSALLYPRSSLMRGGLRMQTAVVDAGFKGTLMVQVENMLTAPYYIGLDDRVVQMVCFDIGDDSNTYDGSYQDERWVINVDRMCFLLLNWNVVS